MYPKERILREFVRNDNGVLSKTYIDILCNFYGPALARLSFIHSLEHFVNHEQLHKRAMCKMYSLVPYTLLHCSEDSSQPYRVGADIGAFLGAYYAASTNVQRLLAGPQSHAQDGRTLWAEAGLLRGLGPYGRGEHPTIFHEFRSAQNKLGEDMVRESRREDPDQSLQIRLQDIRRAYNSKVYDTLSTEGYTNDESLISAISADELFACDNWRAWT